MYSRIIYSGLLWLLLFAACRHKQGHEAGNKPGTAKPVTIRVQPFTGISAKETGEFVAALKEVYPFVELNPPITIPAAAFYPARNRYRADSLINFLSRQTADGFVTLGLTHYDISTTKGAYADWGVMGLGFCPGNACIASTFRLTKERKGVQLFKVAIHEAGHTQGLPHCPVAYCFMLDAEGKNPTDQEKEFCASCKAHLVAKGWQLK